ncbi:hypothetical protein BDZ91DRAFT_749042 [Kalaharituber pfeilii]|nr:hypothetical protein BDZ91DRAFT_749042 [Kalaharituber pfeilii]
MILARLSSSWLGSCRSLSPRSRLVFSLKSSKAWFASCGSVQLSLQFGAPNILACHKSFTFHSDFVCCGSCVPFFFFLRSTVPWLIPATSANDNALGPVGTLGASSFLFPFGPLGALGGGSFGAAFLVPLGTSSW